MISAGMQATACERVETSHQVNTGDGGGSRASVPSSVCCLRDSAVMSNSTFFFGEGGMRCLCSLFLILCVEATATRRGRQTEIVGTTDRTTVENLSTQSFMHL